MAPRRAEDQEWLDAGEKCGVAKWISPYPYVGDLPTEDFRGPPHLLSMETRKRMLVEGLIAGLLGYAAIALFYAVGNLLLGQPLLSTARMLGGHLVAPEVAERVPLAPVLAYNGLHLLMLIIIGMGLSFLVYETERHPQLWFIAFFVGLVGLFFSEVFFAVLMPEIASLSVWSVVGANLLAGLAVGGYLLGSHRRLLRQIEELGEEAL